MTSPGRAQGRGGPQFTWRLWRREFLPVATFAGIFAAFFGYVVWRIRPELFYLLNPVVFLWDAYYLAAFFGEPGGLVNCVSAYLSPLLADAWVGAAVITSLAAVICLATRRYIAAVGGSGGRLLFLLPALLLLTVLGRYIHPIRLCTGLLVALACADAYLLAGRQRVVVRFVLFLVVSAIVYYAAAGLVVVTTCLCGLFELGVQRRRLLGLVYLACGVALPVAAGIWLYDVNIEEAFAGLTLAYWRHWLAAPSSMFTSSVVQAALLLYFPVVAVALLVWRRAARAAGSGVELRESAKPVGESESGSGPRMAWIHWVTPLAVLVTLGIAADLLLFDAPRRLLLQLVESAQQRRWDDVLGYARRLPASAEGALDPRTAAAVNRALYHRGELLDRMFSFPEGMSSISLALVFGHVHDMAVSWPCECGEILFDLGRINESEHLTFEALETHGDWPELLKRLVYIQVLKGEPEAARPFLGLLERSLRHRDWARDCRRQLDADPTLASVPEVASRREMMPTRDSRNDLVDLERMLLGLLERNPRNRMAVEYLLAHYLLNRELDKFVASLPRLDDVGYRRLPRHCEEALVLYLTNTESREASPAVRRIRPETWLRFDRFIRAVRAAPDNVPKATIATQLFPRFGETYYYCYLFGHNRPSEEQRQSEETRIAGS